MLHVTRAPDKRRSSSSRALAASLPLLAAAALFLAGLWLRWPTVYYDGPATQEAFNDYAFDRFVYSDIASLWFRDGLADQPRPHIDYQFSIYPHPPTDAAGGRVAQGFPDLVDEKRLDRRAGRRVLRTARSRLRAHFKTCWRGGVVSQGYTISGKRYPISGVPRSTCTPQVVVLKCAQVDLLTKDRAPGDTLAHRIHPLLRSLRQLPRGALKKIAARLLLVDF
jgi:hypothetical protein